MTTIRLVCNACGGADADMLYDGKCPNCVSEVCYEVWNPSADKPANQQGLYLVHAVSSFAARKEIAAKFNGDVTEWCARRERIAVRG